MRLILFIMYVLLSNITIGNVLLREVAEVRIKKSWQDLTGTASVSFPKALRFAKNADLKLTDAVRRGDKVSIQLGYNDVLHDEFSGYVSLIEQNIPVQIYCEDEMYQLKQKSLSYTWSDAKLRDVVAKIAPGYQAEIAEAHLGAFQINQATPAKVLQYIKDQYKLVAFFRDNTLVVGFPYRFTPQAKVYTYHFQRNVAAHSLEYKTKEDYKVRVKAISNLKNGKKLIVELGDDEGEIRTLNYPELSESQLRNYAAAEMERLKYDGYRGDITGFGWPVVQVGEVVNIVDENYPERQGRYFVDAVEVQFGVDGYRRICTIGKKA